MGHHGLCECGCGRPTVVSVRTDTKKGWVKGRPRRFLLGHTAAGPREVRRCRVCQVEFRPTPGQVRRGVGYYCSHQCSSHARRGGRGRYIGKPFEHVRIATAVLGKPLPASAQVHHVNNDGRDNRHCNLVICQDLAYHKLLHARMRVLQAGGDPNRDLICGHCKRVVPRELMAGRKRKTRCRECAAASSARYRARRRGVNLGLDIPDPDSGLVEAPDSGAVQ